MNRPLLTDVAIGQLTELVVAAHLYDDAAKRDTFFMAMRPFFHGLPRLDSAVDQARSDLVKLAEARAQADGTVPLMAWLEAVASYLETLGLPSEATARHHLAEVEARLRAEAAAVAPLAS